MTLPRSSFRTADWTFDAAAQTLSTASGETVELRYRSAAVLSMLCDAAPDEVSRDTFIKTIWQDRYLVGDKALTNVVWELRRDLPNGADWIRTVPGVGYRLAREIEPSDSTETASSRSKRRGALGVAASLTLVGAAYVLRPLPDTTDLTIETSLITSDLGIEESPDFHAPSRRLAYVALVEGRTAIQITHDTKVTETLPIELGEGMSLGQPVFAPSGKQLAFLRTTMTPNQCAVAVIDLETNLTTDVAEASCFPLGVTPYGLDWSHDGQRLVFSHPHPDGGVGIMSARLDDRTTRFETEPEFLDLLPQFGPKGQLAFIRLINPEAAYLTELAEDGTPRRMVPTPGKIFDFTWLENGSTLAFSRFDDDDWQGYVFRDGTEIRLDLASGVKTLDGHGHELFASIHRSEIGLSSYDMSSWKLTAIPVANRTDESPNIDSASGKLAVVSDRSGYHELWTMDTNGGGATMLTSYEARVQFPSWSPSGKRLSFDRTIDGSGERTTVVKDVLSGDEWSPEADADGGFIAPFWGQQEDQLFAFRTSRERPAELYMLFPFSDREPELVADRAPNALIGAIEDNAFLAIEGDEVQRLDLSTGSVSTVMTLPRHYGALATSSALYYWTAEGQEHTLNRQPWGREPTAMFSQKFAWSPHRIDFDVDEARQLVVFSAPRRRESSIFAISIDD